MPSVPGGSTLFFYEGRTIRGMGLVSGALLVQFGVVLATAAVLVAMALLLGPALVSPTTFLSSLVAVLAAVCGIELGEVAMAAVFLAGFHQIYAGRHEYGLLHARSVDRALVYLIVFVTLGVAGTGYTLASSLFVPSVPVVPAASLLVGNVLLAPLGALFAGLSLLDSARAVAEPAQTRRLRTALILGVVGAVAGPLLNAFALAPGSQYLSAVVDGLLVSAIAGDGVAALSLLLFILAFREIRGELLSGRPAPVLPRFLVPYPYGWAPVDFGVPPQGRGPAPPPKP